MLSEEPQYQPTTRQKWAVWELGSGPPVVCLHGFPDHPVGLSGLASDLAQAGYRVLLPALPGYPPSEPAPDGDYRMPALAADLVDMLDQLGVGRLGLVGHDWGAEIGYELGASHPDRIRVLVALAAPHPAGFRLRRELFAEQQTLAYALYLAFVEEAPEVASDPRWLTSLAQWAAPALWREDWPLITKLIANEDTMREVCLYYRREFEGNRPYREVEVPTTVIYGGQDGAIGPQLFEGLEEWFPRGLEHVLIPPAGHWPHLESPEAVSDAVVAALAASPE